MSDTRLNNTTPKESNHLETNHSHTENELTDHAHPHEDDHDHAHPHEDDHDHDGEHGHDHDHAQGNFFQRLVGGIVHSHSHDEEGGTARYLEESKRGIWALKISLLGLGATALFQIVIVFISGSAALLADTIHNFSDALTAIPLWIAFVIGRRQANHRYTYGYGRAEDLAGLFVVLMILLSAIIAIYESVQKLINPVPITNIGWVIAAAIIGFIGNEAVALFRIKIGKEIGSAALVADGQHARVDGLTSLAVLFGAVGVMLGFPQADPLVGLLISGAILLILKDTGTTMYRRMMDAIEPDFVAKIEQEAAKTKGVQKVHSVRGRWIGHKLFAELSVEVDGQLTVREGHDIGEEVRHKLWHKFPRLGDVILHVDPTFHDHEGEPHKLNAHHSLER
jgi:cation diffusion facilitator family transporter